MISRFQLKKIETFFLLFSAVIFMFGVFGIFQSEASHSFYDAPGFTVSGTLDSAQQNLTVTATGVRTAGVERQNCGEDVNSGSCFSNHHLGNICGPYEGGLRVRDAYVMSGGTASVGGLTTPVLTTDLTQTTSGSVNDVACGTSSSDPGFPAEFSMISKTIDVSSLDNGTYTLSLELCANASTCAIRTTSVTINRASPNFSLSVNPASRTIDQGQSTNYTVSANCSGGLSGPISNLSVTNLHSGATPSWSGNSISCGGSRILTINAPSNAQEGTRTLTISGSASGITRSTTASLTINELPGVVDYVCIFRVTSNISTQGFMNGPGGDTATPPYFTSYEFNTWGDGSPMTQSGQYALYIQSDPTLLDGWHSPTLSPPNTHLCDPSGGDDVTDITVTYQPPDNPPEDPPEDPEELICSASPSSVSVGRGVEFKPTNGNGTYSWSAPGGTPPSGSGNTFITSYGNSGTKTVTVTSGSETATCNVDVIVVSTTEPTCTPATQTVSVGAQASLTTYTARKNGNWFSLGATPQSVFDAYVYRPVYQTPGLKTVNYSPYGAYPDKTCSVNVVAPPTVDLKVNDVNGPVSVAHNGSATLSWTTTNNPTSCTATGPWSGSKAIGGGSQSTGALIRPPSTRTYSISCTNSAGTSAVDSVTVNVGAQPTGTVVVNSRTSDGTPIVTTWDITGATSTQQTTPVASRTYTSQPTGMYSFFPDDLAGYTKSVNNNSQTLTANSTITFTVTYTPTITECGDGADNDGDGFVDGEDPACGDDDDDEDPPNEPQCSDGTDNDGDTKTDYPSDPGCDSNDDNDESNDPPGPDSGGPDFSLSASNNLTIDKDVGETTSNETTIRVNPLEGFSANVTLSILSGPSVTYNFLDTTITPAEYGAGTGETMSVTITPDFPRGNYPIVVQGQGGGLTRTRTVILSVDEQGPTFQEF